MQIDYSVGITSEALIYRVASRKDAIALLEKNAEELSRSATNFRLRESKIYYAGSDSPFRIFSEEYKKEIRGNKQMTKAYIGVQRIEGTEDWKALQGVINGILENPDQQIGVAELATNRQIILSEAAVKLMNCAGEEAVTRDMRKFWHLPDLAELEKNYGLCGTTPFTLTYHSTLDLPASNPEAIWGKATTEFRLIEVGEGFSSRLLYRQGKLIDFELCSTPG